jgi:prepilin-type N-terminal cleavage/methylation domain-containing protein
MRGFTLLEILVALVVASIMFSVLTLNLMPNAKSVLHDESERLAFLLGNGAMASQAGGQSLAWSGSSHEYRFWKRGREGGWLRIEHDNLLHPRTLPQEIHIGTVSFDGRTLEPGALVMLSPELASKRFKVELRDGDLIAEIVGDGLGKVEVIAESAP